MTENYEELDFITTVTGTKASCIVSIIDGYVTRFNGNAEDLILMVFTELLLNRGMKPEDLENILKSAIEDMARTKEESIRRIHVPREIPN